MRQDGVPRRRWRSRWLSIGAAVLGTEPLWRPARGVLEGEGEVRAPEPDRGRGGSVHIARGEASRGYLTNDDPRGRSAVGKAWLAANLEVDPAMELPRGVPKPGPGQHHDHHGFLEAIGRRGLSREPSYLADRLHSDRFYGGACPPRDVMYLDRTEVAEFVPEVCKESKSQPGSRRALENAAVRGAAPPSREALPRAKGTPAGPSDS
jgi:hypothetical protein